MGAIISALATWLLGAFTRLFGMMVNNFLATKIVLGILICTILPIIINNIIYDLMDTMFTTMQTYATANSPTLSTAISFTGLAGYMLNHLGLISAFSIVLSAMCVRFALSWIPFVGPK